MLTSYRDYERNNKVSLDITHTQQRVTSTKRLVSIQMHLLWITSGVRIHSRFLCWKMFQTDKHELQVQRLNHHFMQNYLDIGTQSNSSSQDSTSAGPALSNGFFYRLYESRSMCVYVYPTKELDHGNLHITTLFLGGYMQCYAVA